MTNLKSLLFSACLTAFCVGCSQPAPVQQATENPAGPSGPRIYVTNEVSGDMTIIDATTYKVVATVPLGKRPRGIHASPDGKTIYVALSGSPIGGPDVDESTLPPPDKSADGIGVFDVAQNKVVRMIKAGSDPENFDVSKDGSKIYQRGFENVNNRFGQNCFACHQQAREEFDLICEEDHGCAPIPVTRPMFRALQKTDPRCKNQQPLTQEDKQALVDLAEVVKTLTPGTEPEKKR